MDSTGPRLLFLCTGNAARSVMAGFMMEQRSPATRVTTAGTHVIEGQPMSWRTREAIVAAGFIVGPHRSRQLTSSQLGDVDLVVAMAGEHVNYVRRHLPQAAGRTATLKRLCLDLPPTDGSLTERLGAMALDKAPVAGWEDVDDPAGGELDDFVACAVEIRGLVDQLVDALDGRGALT